MITHTHVSNPHTVSHTGMHALVHVLCVYMRTCIKCVHACVYHHMNKCIAHRNLSFSRSVVYNVEWEIGWEQDGDFLLYGKP